MVLVSSIVASRIVRGILAALVGFWVVDSSPTVVGCVGALELGIPVPVHGLRAPHHKSIKPHEAARYPARL